MIVSVLPKIIDAMNLSEAEMTGVMEEIMTGKASPAQMGAFLTAIRIKGETITELTAAAKVMRNHVTPLNAKGKNGTFLLDTCGTGGDKKSTFNISTVAAFVIAGAGVTVAKHGNRSVTSTCGSADLMQALGININVSVKIIEDCIDQVGLGFLYAPLFHSAMRYVAPVRKEIGVRTIFNMLGPLTNPAMAPAQLIGVYDAQLTEIFSMVLKNLGSKHALIVHGSDHLDEITTTGTSKITELKGDTIETYYLDPAAFDIDPPNPSDLRVEDREHSVAITYAILNGQRGAQRDVVLLNSAAGLIAAGKAKDFREGIDTAAQSIDSGSAHNILKELVRVTNH
jgi:anthranilate phosphoribosyltransferase